MEKTEKSFELQRKSFERAYDTVTELIRESSINVIEVRSSMALLENKFNIICDLDKQLVEHLLNSDKDTDSIDSEIALADTYITKFHSLSLKVESLLYKDDNRSVQSEFSNSHCKHKMKLPKIEMKKFEGDIKDWLHFWGQFQRIDSDSEMANEDKFYYLIQSTIPDSKARQIVESFPPTAANYHKALETLRSRFGRKDLLVEYYVRELLKLVLNNLNSKKKLSYLFDKIECQLRSLETLDVNTETCSAMLYPLVESCLPNDLLKVWQRSSYYNEELSLKDRLENLMSFLKKEVNNEVKYNMVITGFELNKKEDTSTDKNMLPSASALVHLNEKCCIFCEKSHLNEDCPNAIKLPYDDRKQKVMSKGCCLRCLKFGHISKKCQVRVKCSKCNGRHSHIICQKDSDTTQKSAPVPIENSLSNSTYTHVFLQTLKVKLIGDNKNRNARLIFDTGSQRSYISKCAIAEMQYSPLRIEQMVHSLFGGTITETVSHTCFRIRVSSFNDKYVCNFEALDQQIICNNIPCIKNGPWIDELRSFGVDLSDSEDGPIDILVGADIWGKLFTGKKHELSCGLVAYETMLGWTLSGKILFAANADCSSTSTALITSLVCNNHNVTDLWSLDILGITDPAEIKSRKEIEEAVKSNFLKTVYNQTDGRYEVSMPWIEGHPPLPEYSNLALKRLESLMKKLKNDGYYDEYKQVFKDWLEENIIEEVPVEEIKTDGHYLAHRHIVKLNSATTKIRPVFDASAREGNHPALNQCLEKGINFIELIPSIILRFRMYKIGVVSDIRKAFLQVSLCKSDRDFLRFYWYDKFENLTIYRHTRVVFGITCSPFLLGAVIDYHLRRKLDSCDLKYSRATITRLLKSFYVDNCITSLDSIEETQEFIKEATEIMAEAKFDLRGWEHSSFDNSTIQSTDLTSVLGLSWDKNRDTLEISADWFKHMKIDAISRRLILSAAHKLYDPIGFTAPVSLLPKLLLQKSWKTKARWDQEVDVEMREIFLNWFNDLPSLFNINIPRWLHVSPDKKCSLHVFCDASKDAYAAVVYLRSELPEMISVQLVQAKSRVSPLKQLSIARLKLLVATIAARLAKSVAEDFDFELPVVFWTDSTTVLTWINREPQWKSFVLNRISEIRKITDRKFWFYVPSELNPADLPSRGCSPKQLIKSKWWEGPEWLKKSSEFRPVQNYCYDEEKILEERRKQIVNSLFFISTNENLDWYHKYSHDYDRIVKVVA